MAEVKEIKVDYIYNIYIYWTRGMGCICIYTGAVGFLEISSARSVRPLER